MNEEAAFSTLETVEQLYGHDADVFEDKTLEELKELEDAIYDYRMNSGDDEREHLAEELADVANCLYHLCQVLGFSRTEVLARMAYKANRQIIRRIKGE